MKRKKLKTNWIVMFDMLSGALSSGTCSSWPGRRTATRTLICSLTETLADRTLIVINHACSLNTVLFVGKLVGIFNPFL